MTEGLPEPVVSNSLGRQVIHRMGQAIMANGGNGFSV